MFTLGSLPFLPQSCKLAIRITSNSQHLGWFGFLVWFFKIFSYVQDELERDKGFPSGQCWKGEFLLRAGAHVSEANTSDVERAIWCPLTHRWGGHIVGCSLLREMAVVKQQMNILIQFRLFKLLISIWATWWAQHQGGLCVCVREGNKMAFPVSICAVFGFSS